MQTTDNTKRENEKEKKERRNFETDKTLAKERKSFVTQNSIVGPKL